MKAIDDCNLLGRRKIFPLTQCWQRDINRAGWIRPPGSVAGTALYCCLWGQAESRLPTRAHLGRRKTAQARHAKPGAAHGRVLWPLRPAPPKSAGESSETDCGAVCLTVKTGKSRVAECWTGRSRRQRIARVDQKAQGCAVKETRR